jgi:hypothetical protein
MIKAKSRDKGIVDATTKPQRQFPNKNTRINITISAPSIKLFFTVDVLLAISLLLSKKGFIRTPSGNYF